MRDINLSYVITTYNKLPYLKNVLSTLLQNVEQDEEIVITDGGSTDGTPEYLMELLKIGKIHQFISEKDSGEAHGWNKAFLLAKGKLIKVITDDDIFYYSEIRKCKEFMLSHPEIDVLGTDGILSKATNESAFTASKNYNKNNYSLSKSLEDNYIEWRDNSKPFSFCGLGWMIRKNSLPLIGLLDTSFARVDAEYSIRITAGKANLAYYTGEVWMRILNPNSNYMTMVKRMREDTDRLNIIYPGSNLEEDFTWYDLIPENLKPSLRLLRDKITKKNIEKNTYIPNNKDIENLFKNGENYLAEVNTMKTGQFLFRK